MSRINVQDLTEVTEVAPDGFTCNGYSVNYSIKTLVDKLNSHNLILPDFQRKFVWGRKAMQSFLRSSVIDNVPITNLLFIIDPKDPESRPHILDGQQRLSTMAFFISGYLTLGEGRVYNKAKFTDLPENVQNFILNKEVPVLKVTSERKYWSYIFRTLNKGGVPLNEIELRRSVYDFPLMFELNQIAEHNNEFVTLFGKNNRFKGQHVLLRALAMHDGYKTYQKPLVSFLDKFCNKMKDLSDTPLAERITQDFIDKFNLIVKALYSNPKLGKNSFRLAPSKPVNIGMIDCMFHAGLMLLEADKDKKLTVDTLGKKLQNVYDRIVKDNYAMTISLTTDTSGRENVLNRMSLTESFVKLEDK